MVEDKKELLESVEHLLQITVMSLALVKEVVRWQKESVKRRKRKRKRKR